MDTQAPISLPQRQPPILRTTQRTQRPLQLFLRHHDRPRPRRAQIAHLDCIFEFPRRAAHQPACDAAHDSGRLHGQVAQIQGDGGEELVFGAEQDVRGEIGE